MNNSGRPDNNDGDELPDESAGRNLGDDGDRRTGSADAEGATGPRYGDPDLADAPDVALGDPDAESAIDDFVMSSDDTAPAMAAPTGSSPSRAGSSAWKWIVGLSIPVLAAIVLIAALGGGDDEPDFTTSSGQELATGDSATESDTEAASESADDEAAMDDESDADASSSDEEAAQVDDAADSAADAADEVAAVESTGDDATEDEPAAAEPDLTPEPTPTSEPAPDAEPEPEPESASGFTSNSGSTLGSGNTEDAPADADNDSDNNSTAAPDPTATPNPTPTPESSATADPTATAEPQATPLPTTTQVPTPTPVQEEPTPAPTTAPGGSPVIANRTLPVTIAGDFAGVLPESDNYTGYRNVFDATDKLVASLPSELTYLDIEPGVSGGQATLRIDTAIEEGPSLEQPFVFIRVIPGAAVDELSILSSDMEAGMPNCISLTSELPLSQPTTFGEEPLFFADPIDLGDLQGHLAVFDGCSFGGVNTHFVGASLINAAGDLAIVLVGAPTTAELGAFDEVLRTINF